MSGYTDLVIEYYQHPTDAIMRFRVTPLSLESATLTAQPTDLSLCPGDSAHFSVGATGNGHYQWQVNSGSGFANVSNNGYIGTQTARLSFPAREAMDGWQFRCLITTSNTCQSNIQSDSVVLRVGGVASLAQQPKDQEVCNSNTALFAVTSNPTGPHLPMAEIDR